MHLTRAYLIEKRYIESCKTTKRFQKYKYLNLDLSGKKISSIDTNAFSSLDLKRLNLASNDLITLDSSTLSGLFQLREINLSSNKLVSLDPNFFQCLKRRTRISDNIKGLFSSSSKQKRIPKLTQIDLKSNQLNSIDPLTFNGLTNLEIISLKSNKLVALDANCFKDLVNLKCIELSFNMLSNIDSKCFQGLINLKKIDLSRNNIKILNANIFSGLVNLEEINLSENKIEFLDSNTFAGLASLKSINLGHNNIFEIDPDLFNGLSNLEIISLEFNEIDLLDSFTFQNLVSLKEINLYNNMLTTINSKMFYGLKQLEYIYFSFNKINYIDAKSFRGLTSLKAVHLSFNEITSLERKLFKGLINLNEILLEHNQISHIDLRAFKGLTYLNKINLSNNLISFIDPYVFVGLNIRTIDLDENYLSTDSQFNLICNLPKNVLSVAKQKELNQSDGTPLANLTTFIDSMQRKEALMNRKLHQEIEKRKKLEEKFNSLSAHQASLMFARAKANRCSLRSNKSDYYDANDYNQLPQSASQPIQALYGDKSQETLENEIDKEDQNELPDLIPTEVTQHRFADEIERVVQEHIRIDLIDDLNSNVWQLFHEEGEMKVYKRDLEKDGIVLDPLKAVHKVKGITGHELCKYFFDPDIRMEWEATIESSKVVEKLSDDSIIFHQVVKRVWPSAQRDSVFWSHMRSFEIKTNKNGIKDWIVVNYSCDHDKAPIRDGIVRAQANVAMICSTEILNKNKLNDLQSCTRDEVVCKITYVSQVNPGGWVPAKALRAVYKNVYPKFVKGFGEFVIQKTKGKPILF